MRFPPVKVQEAFHTECPGERESVHVYTGVQTPNSRSFVEIQACDGWHSLAWDEEIFLADTWMLARGSCKVMLE